MKIIKYTLIVLLAALIIIQFIRPEKNSGGYESVALFEKETKPSAEVAILLKENCYDCHSDQTQYPWYAEIAPISFWLDDHIEHGKGHFNASAWDSYSIKKKDHKMEELVEMVEEGEMPLKEYTWIHGDITEAEQKLILQWAGLVRLQYKNQLQVSSK
ncbi:MAG: cytochrome C [Flavobacteriaceae bacterium]|nr:cytochrome C [Flavobacteriaceae bacterium]|tara:strand:+ start:19939 stop:20412 length:474 start_codon:yes stop_codon:yes gene_type:complete